MPFQNAERRSRDYINLVEGGTLKAKLRIPQSGINQTWCDEFIVYIEMQVVEVVS
jgi:hypothetical protein